MDYFGIILIVLLKYAIPVGVAFFPFAAGWANFVLDTIDGDILIPLGLADHPYQLIDKVADWATYIGMVAAAYRFRWPIRKWIYALFIFRSIGQILFLFTGNEAIFFYFPNFLEPLFLIYATIAFFKKAKAPETYLKYRWVIWLFVILYKMQDEYITHIGNIDRTDFIRNLFR